MMHAGSTHIFAIQDGRADVELQKGLATWRFSPSKLAEVLEKLDAMKASPGPCHHYVDVSSPAETLVLSRDAYVSIELYLNHDITTARLASSTL
jgi:hypothetical protein